MSIMDLINENYSNGNPPSNPVKEFEAFILEGKHKSGSNYDPYWEPRLQKIILDAYELEQEVELAKIIHRIKKTEYEVLKTADMQSSYSFATSMFYETFKYTESDNYFSDYKNEVIPTLDKDVRSVLMLHPEKFFDRFWLFYDDKSQYHQHYIEIFEADGSRPEETKYYYSNWHSIGGFIGQFSPQEYKQLRKAAEIYWTNLVEKNLDNNGKISAKAMPRLLKMAEDYLRYDQQLIRHAKHKLIQTIDGNISSINSGFGSEDYLKRQEQEIEKAQKDLYTLNKLAPTFECDAIRQIAVRAQELGIDLDKTAKKPTTQKHKQPAKPKLSPQLQRDFTNN